MSGKKTKDRRIVVRDVEYRWAAMGQDGYISLTIKPTIRIGPVIESSFSYGESVDQVEHGFYETTNDKIVITNRIVKRVIEYVINNHGYSPTPKGKPLRISWIDREIDMSDVIRISDT